MQVSINRVRTSTPSKRYNFSFFAIYIYSSTFHQIQSAATKSRKLNYELSMRIILNTYTDHNLFKNIYSNMWVCRTRLCFCHQIISIELFIYWSKKKEEKIRPKWPIDQVCGTLSLCYDNEHHAFEVAKPQTSSWTLKKLSTLKKMLINPYE